jgi:3-hydroxyisobutyrate dehydrogenase
VKIVYLDPETGLLAGCKKDSTKLFLETSTIEASASLEVLKAVKESVPSSRFLDAPVSGGIPPAHAGTLTFMVGGPKEIFEDAKPIMATMGKPENLIHCGGPGAGLATKQINNYIAYCSYVALCEGNAA